MCVCQGVEVVAVGIGGKEAAKKFAKLNAFPEELLYYDENGQCCELQCVLQCSVLQCVLQCVLHCVAVCSSILQRALECALQRLLQRVLHLNTFPEKFLYYDENGQCSQLQCELQCVLQCSVLQCVLHCVALC